MRYFIFAHVFMVVLLSLTACGIRDSSTALASPTITTLASIAPPIPTTTPPRTRTPVPTVAPTTAPVPSATAPSVTLPPTATLASTTNVNVAKVILAAMKRTRSATNFKLEQQTIGKGGLENIAFFLGEQDANEAVFIDSLTLTCNGANCATQMRGASTGLLGADPHRGIEALTVNGDGYFRGPITILQLPEDRWYRQPGQPNPFAVSILPSTELYGYVDNGAYAGSETEEQLATFGHIGQEVLDGVQCDVYATADKAVTFDALRTKIGSNLLISNVTSFEGDGTTEFTIWTCGDGYFHQMQLRFVGHDTTRPDTLVERSYRLHIFQYNEPVVITPPAEAITVTPTH